MTESVVCPKCGTVIRTMQVHNDDACQRAREAVDYECTLCHARGWLPHKDDCPYKRRATTKELG